MRKNYVNIINGCWRNVSHFLGLVLLAIGSCQQVENPSHIEQWDIAVLPPSVRLDPLSNHIIESKTDLNQGLENILHGNWIYDGEKVNLHSARGEYVSFQLVLTNYSDEDLSNIQIESSLFNDGESKIKVEPELFLEWSVNVLTPSTGYPKASLGQGWYPDALIPLEMLQMDSSKVHRRWTYPLRLPDFNNRIADQKSLIIWVDQYIPFNRSEALPGVYKSSISVTVNDETKEIPLSLKVWDFAISNRNLLGAALQQEGFVSRKFGDQALKIYQLLKRNRMSVMDPTYKPELIIEQDGEISLDWTSFDEELVKYFDGSAFTKEYGYAPGPGYGEPIENFVLPFDVYGKHGTRGWPDTGKPEVERNKENLKLYIKCITKVRSHLQDILDPDKTDLTVYLNGLDESYFQQAWDRMVFYGDLFQKYYPEAHFRIDGAYSEEAMDYVSKSIDYWGSHTINYNAEEVKKYQDLGIKNWLYGPMIYESKVNGWVGSSTFIDLPLINDRAISWSCWKYDIHSWLSWGIGVEWKRAWYDPETWKDVYKSGSGSDVQFPFKKINGSALLVYSGGIIPLVNEPCPSIRLKAMRDGVQEYEYLRLISQLSGGPETADEIVNTIINEPFGDDAIGVIDVWDYNPENWNLLRIKMGERIENLTTR